MNLQKTATRVIRSVFGRQEVDQDSFDPLVDSPDEIRELEKSINEASSKASVVWIAFITFELYLRDRPRRNSTSRPHIRNSNQTSNNIKRRVAPCWVFCRGASGFDRVPYLPIAAAKLVRPTSGLAYRLPSFYRRDNIPIQLSARHVPYVATSCGTTFSKVRNKCCVFDVHLLDDHSRHAATAHPADTADILAVP